MYHERLGEKLRWVRTRLDLKPVEVYKPLDIAKSTFHDREQGKPHADLRVISKIASFYNNLWQTKFLEYSNYPKLGGEEVHHITLHFFAEYTDTEKIELQQISNILHENYKNKELFYLERLLG